MENTTFPTGYDDITVMANATSLRPLLHGDPKPPEGCMVVAQGDFTPWDNPDNLVSSRVENAVGAAVAVVFLPVLFLVGTPANVVNAVVFWRQGLKERINVCLFSLSIADLAYMVHSFLLNVDRLYLQFAHTPQLGLVFKFIVDHKLVGFRGLSWVSGFLSTLIACERCFCVVSPLRSKTVLRTGTTAVLIVLSSLLILAGFFLVCTRWSIACVFDPLTGTVSDTVYGSEFYTQNRNLLDILDGFVYGLVLPGLYVTIVSVTTVLTSLRLRKMAEWREQTSSASVSSREVALTRMLIGISVLYVVCTLPILTLGLCILFVPDISLKGRYYNTFNLMVSVFELFSYINASVNFFVYCFLGSKYKETLKEMFRCGGKVVKRTGEREKRIEAEISEVVTEISAMSDP